MNPTAPSTKSFGQRCRLILGVAAALTLFFATRDYFGQREEGLRVTLGKDIWWKAMEWYGWALFSPAIFWVCRKNDFHNGRWRLVLNQMAFAAIFSLAHVCILTTGARIEAQALQTGFTWPRLFRIVLINHFHEDVLTYAGIVSVWYAWDYYRQFRCRERQAIELEVHLAKARLQALKVQLHPHFLFNTLNGVASLVYEEPKAAHRMLVRLSELLRMTLDDDGAQEVSLLKELEFNQLYLELEKIRLGNRLTVNLEIAPETLDAYVPSLLLQPLVENALHHAIAPYSAPGRLSIRASREDKRLILRVEDSGPGIADSQLFDTDSGVGLVNTRARLQQLYGAAHTFELKNRDQGGLVVSISIPFRTNQISAQAVSASIYEDSHSHR